mmetsp:Transcript_23333/g.66114  ORF Transcript_23333/g.66114 Transcript_23333/m.66114 type:complete len:367 (-) Transcript_23333:326-1426(-)
MSWFSAGLDALKDVTEKVAQVTEKVAEAVPIDREMIAKLTLNTEDMKAERQQFGDEAARKAHVKNMLSGIYPWETKDAEREILVDECKEAILALSSNEDTFFGPYEVPPLPVKTLAALKTSSGGVDAEDGDDDGSNNNNNKDDENENEEGVEGDDEEGDTPEASVNRQRLPSPDSLEKLSKLEPLPPLLSEFDLDSHVGLIQKLLAIDPQLVKMQSTLSGGGERELVFWRNYFFHCAFTRYEAGLSIDEIWSFTPQDQQDDNAAAAASTEGETTAVAGTEEETVEFEGASQDSAQAAAVVASAGTESPDNSNTDGANDTFGATSSSNSLAMSNEFEFVGDVDDVSDAVADPELDELEAEIARELED